MAGCDGLNELIVCHGASLQLKLCKDNHPNLLYKPVTLRTAGVLRVKFLKVDGVVKGQKVAFYVIPAKAGIYSFRLVMDSGSSPE
jgi:hypothetical protein